MILSDLILAYGDIVCKRWLVENDLRWAFVGLVCCVVVFCFWLVVLKNVGELGRASSIWSSTGAVTGVLIGHFYFHEPLLLKHKIGIVLGLLGSLIVAL